MSGEYELVTLKDVYNKIPPDKVDTCLAEIAVMIKQAQAVRSRQPLGGWSMPFPESLTWIDDGKGDVETTFAEASTGATVIVLKDKVKLKES